MIIPAFIDSHLHILGIGYYEDIINLNKSKSIAEIITLVEKSDRDLVIARGFNQDQFKTKAMPTKNDFLNIKKPLVLFRICGHVAVVNQAMLDLIKINQATPQIEGGSFDYNTGIFTEKALGLVYKQIPKPSFEDLKRYLIKANKILISQGITKVASDDFSSFGVDFETIIKAINAVDEAGLLDVEITEQVNLPIDELKRFIALGYANKRYHNYKMGPLKILADGSLGGKTAALNLPYENDLKNFGILTYSDKELTELVETASSVNMDTVIHAIGDRASDQAIAAIANAQEKYPRKNPNNAIIHAQLTNHRQIEEMKNYGIGAIVQPIFINTDIKIIEERIGSRAKESYLFKSMHNQIITGFSTDSPVESTDPFMNIYCAVTQKSIDYPQLPAFNEKECFTVKEALKAYTSDNLRFVYDQEHLDYIEIDTDIFAAEVDKIKNIKVLKTYKNNRLVYERKNS